MAAVAAHLLAPPLSAPDVGGGRPRALSVGSGCPELFGDRDAKPSSFSIMESIVVTVDALCFSPHRGVDAVCDRSKSAMAEAPCCSDFLSVNDADDNHYLFRSHSQSNMGSSSVSVSARPGRSHSVLGAGAGLSLSCTSSSPECSPTPSPALTPKTFGGDDVGEFVIDFASCLDFQITTEHVQVPTIDIYALAKKHSSKYGSSSRAKRQGLFRAETGTPVVPKPRSVSIFGSLLAQAAGDEDTDMLDDDRHGVLTRAQSDSVALEASSASSSPLASLFKRAKRMKGACGARLKGGVDSRRRRALDFSDKAAAPSPTKASLANVHPSAASLPFGGRQRSPSGAVPRPSTLTRKRSRDFLGRDHDHPANMPLQRGRKTMRSRPTDDCSSSPCLVPEEQPPTSFFPKLNAPTETRRGNDTDGDFPLPSTPSLSSQSQLSQFSRSPSSPSLSLSLANDSFSLSPTDRSTNTSTNASVESVSVFPAPASRASHKAANNLFNLQLPISPENNNRRSSFSALLDDCDTDIECERGTSLSCKENRDPSGTNSMNSALFSSESACRSTTKKNGARRALAMGALDDDSDVEMDVSKPDPIKLPEMTNVLPPLRMAPLNANILSPPKSAPAVSSSLAQDPRTLIHSHTFSFGHPQVDMNNSRPKNTSPVKFPCVSSTIRTIHGVQPMPTRRSPHTRARSNTQTREVHTFSADQFAHVGNLSASEMSQTCPLPSTGMRKPKPVMGPGLSMDMKSSMDNADTQQRKNSLSRPVPVMPSVPNFVSLDVVNENTTMDDGECAAISASERDSSPSRSCTTILPIVRKNCMIPEISGATLRDLVGGAYRDKFDNFAVVDCRYVFEYRGGHIKGAISLWRKNDLTSFYHANRDSASHKRVALIFHCEYSKNRGPRAAAHFRKLDRTHNDYPQLSFPNLFVLSGGYRQFYRSLQADPRGSMDLYCDPPAYVSMWDEKFIRENKMCKDLEKPRRANARSRTASTSDVW